MAQPTSPSLSPPDGSTDDHQANNSSHVKSSNTDVPIDPSISQASPTYPPYSPYPPDQMHQGYQPQPHGYMPQPRPPHDQWGGYPPQHGMPPYGHPPPGVQGPPPSSGGGRPGQVSFENQTRESRRPVLTCDFRCTALFPSPVLSNTSGHEDDMKRLSACTSVDGMVVRRHMVLSITSMHT